ncbi:MAG: DUF4358 domain-containing protein [Eubacteriales bacterium]|nr:DUF4358 domain-containing protein [Eubacteriales bacterium]
MKRSILFVLCLSALLSALLVGCGSKGGSDTEGVLPAGTNLEDLYAEGMDALYQTYPDAQDNITMLPDSMDFMASYCPGIEAYQYKQSVIYLHPVTGAACEVLLFELENSDDVSAVKTILQSHIDERANDTGYPETAAQWKNNAKVTSSGSFVFLAVFPDSYALPAQFILE